MTLTTKTLSARCRSSKNHSLSKSPKLSILSILFCLSETECNISARNRKLFVFRVYMRCVTWSRDSHGLFDYESRYIAKKNIKTQSCGRIVRLNNDVEFVDINTKPEHIDQSAKPLITLSQDPTTGKHNFEFCLKLLN